MLFHHLKNLLELTLYAGLSCGAAFLSRIYPGLFYPVLIFRIAIVFYCLYMISHVENQRVVANIILVASLVGFVGGFWDYIELLLVVDYTTLVWIFAVIGVCLFATVLLKSFLTPSYEQNNRK